MPMPPKVTVFYSWQSDLPGKTNRNFLQEALEHAVKSISDDASISVEPVMDRDTLGTPGSPDIANTIYSKIETATVFVGDISIVNSAAVSTGISRAVPNPNVLIELGYAMKAIGHDSIITLFNTAFGRIEDLPFDLRMRRVTTYFMPEESPRADERRRLEKVLVEALRAIFAHMPAAEQPGELVQPPSPFQLAYEAVIDQKPAARLLIRRYMEWLLESLDGLDTLPSREGTPTIAESLDLFMESLDKAIPFVADFAKLASVIALSHQSQYAVDVFKGLTGLAERFYLSRTKSGLRSWKEDQFDFFRFIGNEMFIIFVAMILKEGEWSILSAVLETDIVVSNWVGDRQMSVDFNYFIQTIYHMGYYNSLKRPNSYEQLWGHIDLLSHHFDDERLSSVLSFRDYVEADFFLYMREAMKTKDGMGDWANWTIYYAGNEIPWYLAKIRKRSFAELLLKPFNVTSIEALRGGITAIKQRLSKPQYMRSNPLFQLDPATIGVE